MLQASILKSSTYLGLDPSVERTMIGFMGCYAAINALKAAHHIVRSEPDAAVLVLNLELCTLHFQETHALEQVLSFLVFADGGAASLVTAQPTGLAIDSFLAVTIPRTSHLITWRIGELGFDMQLSGEVPGEIGRALKEAGNQITRGKDPLSVDLWAVHPGGRSILDAVEKGLSLPARLSHASRDILSRFGNMSSATVMFVLQQIMQQAQSSQTRLRHVLRPRTHRGNHALPCRITCPTSAAAPSSPNSWMSPARREEMRACLRDLAWTNSVTLAYRPLLHWLRAQTPLLSNLSQPSAFLMLAAAMATASAKSSDGQLPSHRCRTHRPRPQS